MSYRVFRAGRLYATHRYHETYRYCHRCNFAAPYGAWCAVLAADGEGDG